MDFYNKDSFQKIYYTRNKKINPNFQLDSLDDDASVNAKKKISVRFAFALRSMVLMAYKGGKGGAWEITPAPPLA